MKRTIFLILILISLTLLVIRFGSLPATYLLGLKEQAGLKVLSTPEGAEVLIDGQKVGQTPFEDARLTTKELTVKLQSNEGSWEGKASLNHGTWTVINRELAKDQTSETGEILSLEKGKGVVVLSTPTSAAVEIDGLDLGQTPFITDLKVGEHTFVISKENYIKRSIRALLPTGYRLNLSIDLALTEANLTSLTPPTSETVRLVVLSTPTNFLRIRSHPSLQGEEIARVSPGTELIFLEELPLWYRVKLPSGQEGYVSAGYVEKKIP